MFGIRVGGAERERREEGMRVVDRDDGGADGGIVREIDSFSFFFIVLFLFAVLGDGVRS